MSPKSGADSFRIKYDFFPIEGTRESVGRTKRFWDLYGKGDISGCMN
jgi:hypothetical protein